MLMLAWPACVAAAWSGVLLDRWLGEPRRWHPLVGFGRMAASLERRLNDPARRGAPWRQRLAGLAGWGLLVLVPAALTWWLVAAMANWHPLAALALHAMALYA